MEQRSEGHCRVRREREECWEGVLVTAMMNDEEDDDTTILQEENNTWGLHVVVRKVVFCRGMRLCRSMTKLADSVFSVPCPPLQTRAHHHHHHDDGK